MIAAVVSEAMVAAMYTPCVQSYASETRGTVVVRRPPNRNALIGTPFGLSQYGSSEGICSTATVKRAFACAAGFLLCGSHRLPCQSMRSLGGSLVSPSHHTSPSGVIATLVKIVFERSAARQLRFVSSEVPGATPKAPASGLIAYSWPSAPGLIQAMSSPIVVTFQPCSDLGGMSIARFVLPQA